jgi:hypothetical protein
MIKRLFKKTAASILFCLGVMPRGVNIEVKVVKKRKVEFDVEVTFDTGIGSEAFLVAFNETHDHFLTKDAAAIKRFVCHAQERRSFTRVIYIVSSTWIIFIILMFMVELKSQPRALTAFFQQKNGCDRTVNAP